MASAASVFEEIKVSYFDQWTHGPQKRAVMASKENMKVVYELEKGNSQRFCATKLGLQ